MRRPWSEAIRGRNVDQMSYWDAQVWATAKLNQIPVVYMEDFQEGQMLEGVLFQNPSINDKPKNRGE